MAQNFNEQPGRVAAGAGALRERFLRALHAGFHADHITNVALQFCIERDEKIRGPFAW